LDSEGTPLDDAAVPQGPATTVADLSRSVARVQTSGSRSCVSVAGNCKFYAVRRGRTPGLYFSWADCSQEVLGFKGCEYQSFKSLSEAEEYLFAATVF